MLLKINNRAFEHFEAKNNCHPESRFFAERLDIPSTDENIRIINSIKKPGSSPPYDDYPVHKDPYRMRTVQQNLKLVEAMPENGKYCVEPYPVTIWFWAQQLTKYFSTFQNTDSSHKFLKFQQWKIRCKERGSNFKFMVLLLRKTVLTPTGAR